MKNAKNIFRQYLKEAGMLYSRQREQILDVFLQTERHSTIGDLHELVKRENPRIGLATVYRTMRIICQAGLARETDFGDGFRRFEHKYRHQHHDHLVCLECGRVIEVISPEIEGLQETLARRHEFVPTSHKMQIFGVCRACERDADIKRNKE